jgi:ParB family transcriptional regulator, chromosome partitioning protein
MPFDPCFATEGLREAEYNPRKITPDALESLQGSIRELGFCKPIIVTPDGLIVAGHQRTKAARTLGITHVPAWVLSDVNLTDEARFNQLHNGTDLDDIDRAVHVPPSTGVGFEETEGAAIQGDLRSRGAAVRAEICKLLLRHGPWGGIVATQSGEVVSSPQYALACQMLGIPCRTYRIRDDQGPLALKWFGKIYGEFSYDHLPKTTWKQTFAQKMRLRGDSHARSTLYTNLVIPAYEPGMRVLDFGCGQADYVKRLRAASWRIWGIEFFFRCGGKLDTALARGMIDAALKNVSEEGLFDVVVCDSVVNSVDSVQAEHDVMTCVAAFCKPGGTVFFSGRTRSSVENRLRMRRSTNATQRQIEFLDPNGLSAVRRKGGWFYQKFHSPDEADQLAIDHVGEPQASETLGSSWRIQATKTRQPDWATIESAVRREFDLSWPNGNSVGRADEAVEVLAPHYRDAKALPSDATP